MRFIKAFRIFENDNYKDTSWTMKIDGKEVTITVKDVEDYLDKEGIKSIDIPVKDIKDMSIHKNKKDK